MKHIARFYTRSGFADLKILHVYKDFDPPVRGGIERHIALMCRYQRAWADVEALTCSRGVRTRRVVRDGTNVLEVGEWGRFQSAPMSPLYPYYLRRAKADVMVVQVPNPTAEIACLIARPRAKLIVRYQSDVIRQRAAMKVHGPVLMKFLGKADMILASSEQYMETSPYLQAFRDKCRVVPLGIRADEFGSPDLGAVETLKSAYGAPFVLYSGRHRYYKGLEYLVRAAERIHGTVVIAGGGPERARLEALAEEVGVDVRFPGSLGEQGLVDHLHACSVFAFPSVERSEAFGISMLEAHACGKPVVSTTLGTGVEFVNLDGQTGFNVPPREPDALAEAVNRLLDDHELAERLGSFAQERVMREFDARRVAEQEFALYQEVL